MRKSTKLILALLGVAGAGIATLGVRAARLDRHLDRLEVSLRSQSESAGLTFEESMVAGLPGPAQRYLRRAIAPGTRIASSASFSMSGRMKPSPEAAFVDIAAEETLAPMRGFVWRARLRMSGLPITVVDHYHEGYGEVAVAALGLVPLQRSSGPDIARSTRGRLAAESAWIPSLHLPVLGASWEPIDETAARVSITVDGEPFFITLKVDEDGRLLELTMLRHGDVGVPSFRPIPYGFAVESEATFQGYTVASRLTGGWWYGTDRYDPANASSFALRDIRYW
jgi:hypothetical protein